MTNRKSLDKSSEGKGIKEGCRICKVITNETRFGVCWKCAEAESIIGDGTDMYDKGLDGLENPARTAMDKLRLLIQKGWK